MSFPIEGLWLPLMATLRIAQTVHTNDRSTLRYSRRHLEKWVNLIHGQQRVPPLPFIYGSLGVSDGPLVDRVRETLLYTLLRSDSGLLSMVKGYLVTKVIDNDNKTLIKSHLHLLTVFKQSEKHR